ncbi:478_t:CDS:2 [Diversispora eburnea]|uniref:478_t:CDS:1 n=1 Tax=Diversispora eburnea TaxID=1213867 RepID=A0A9N9CN56_9GLOM|nr:478_t:CDS:2 [Diversispora eburnea]
MPDWQNGEVGPKVAYHTVSFGGSQNELLVIYGGESLEEYPPTNSLFYYDTATENWEIPIIVASKRRQEHTAVTRLNDPSIFIFGGISDTNDTKIQLNELFDLNISNGSWSTLSPDENTPSPRYHHTATILSDGKMYIIGGISGEDLVDISQIYVYDTYKSQWSVQNATGNPPLNRRDHAAVGTNDGKVIIHGGVDITFLNPYQDIGVLDTTNIPYKWLSINVEGSIPPGRYSHTATMVGTNMIIAFGLTVNDTSDANIYTLDTTTYKWVDEYQPNNLEYTSTTPPEVMKQSPEVKPTNTKKSSESTNIMIIVLICIGSMFILSIFLGITCYWYTHRTEKDNKFHSKSFLEPRPQYPIKNERTLTIDDSNQLISLPPIHPFTITDETQEMTLEDRVMGADIQTINRSLVPKATLHVVNPDKEQDDKGGG